MAAYSLVAIALVMLLLIGANLVHASNIAIQSTSGPFMIVRSTSPLLTLEDAMAACAAHGTFLGIPTTWSELDFTLAALVGATTSGWGVHVGLRRNGSSSHFVVADGPLSGTEYSHGENAVNSSLTCSFDARTWYYDQPSSGDAVLIDRFGSLKAVLDAREVYHALCQACVEGQVGCSYDPPPLLMPSVIATSGPFVLTDAVFKSTITMANRICTELGGWLALPHSYLADEYLIGLRSHMTVPYVWMDGFARERGVFVRMFGPKAGQVISRGLWPNALCEQPACFWAQSMPSETRWRRDIILLYPRLSRSWYSESHLYPLRTIHQGVSVLCQRCEIENVTCYAAVVGTAGPYKLLSPGKYSYADAKKACKLNGGFLAAVTTYAELDYAVHLMLTYATKYRAIAGVKRGQIDNFTYTIDDGPNRNSIYTWGKTQGWCAQDVCNWGPDLDRVHREFTFIHRRGYMFDTDDVENLESHVMCQTCVSGDANCSFPPPDVKTPKVVAEVGEFALTVADGKPKTRRMANRMCEKLGGSLSLYSNPAGLALVSNLTSKVTEDVMVDGIGVEDFKRDFGPMAGAKISRGFSPLTQCDQPQCNWGPGQPSDEGTNAPEMIVLRVADGKWMGHNEMLSLTGPYHLLCQQRTGSLTMSRTVSRSQSISFTLSNCTTTSHTQSTVTGGPSNDGNAATGLTEGKLLKSGAAVGGGVLGVLFCLALINYVRYRKNKTSARRPQQGGLQVPDDTGRELRKPG